MTQHVMIDIETIGLEPGSVIASIGAVRFGPGEVVPDRGEQSRDGAFYASVDIESCQDVGLTIDADTLKWWFDQPDVAQAQLRAGIDLSRALHQLSEFVDGADYFWANSPKFDMAHLEAAYDAYSFPVPWDFYQLRDYRTLTALPGAQTASTDGVEHHALDDAYNQAAVAAATLAAMEDAHDE